ncbi:MAG: Serine/threonine-protein phosphatase [candidate division TM6 bacterium GW2011_GWF2_28_16]|nr:MAG: Serine/threonine-protein phosphatase [candidate division TM6 bacterium GW2011_GWF2_28_16]
MLNILNKNIIFFCFGFLLILHNSKIYCKNIKTYEEFINSNDNFETLNINLKFLNSKDYDNLNKNLLTFILMQIERLSNKNYWLNQEIPILHNEEEDSNNSKYYVEKQNINNNFNAIIIGDLHGNYYALEAIIKNLISRQILNNNLILNNNYKIIFLGDIIDRGTRSIENILLVMFLKYLNQENVIVLRGNHETLDVSKRYGFYNELKFFGQDLQDYIFNKFNIMFELLPSAYFLTNKNFNFMFCHGGYSLINYNEYFLNNDSIKYAIEPDDDNPIMKYGIKSNNLFWSDTDIYSQYNFATKNTSRGYKFPLKNIFDVMQLTKITAKFGGHGHTIPKNIFYNTNDLSTAQIEEYSVGYANKDNVFWIMSGQIANTDPYSSDNFIPYIKYYPSYLELEIEEKKYSVSGWSNKNKNIFEKETLWQQEIEQN